MCMDTKNMELYAKFKDCPKEAKKEITAGRLRGKTDINPMWRIKRLTEEFGACGFGWITKIERTWIEEGANGERTANVEISLKVKYEGQWSEPIPGIGGSALIAKENNGLYTDDDCFKKAYTDAISVACKALGVAADVYFEKDPDSKYTGEKGESKNDSKSQGNEKPTISKYSQIMELIKPKGLTLDDVNAWITARFKQTIKINDLTDEQFSEVCKAINNAKK